MLVKTVLLVSLQTLATALVPGWTRDRAAIGVHRWAVPDLLSDQPFVPASLSPRNGSIRLLPQPKPEQRTMSGFTPGRETWRIKIEKQLDQFCRSANRELQFPPSLTSEERRFVHAHAPKLGLKTKSQGKGSDRFLTVWKPQRVVALAEDAPRLDLAKDASVVLDAHFKAHPPTAEELGDAREGRVADAQPSPEPGTVRSTLKNVKNRHKSKAAVIEYAKRAPECVSAPSSMVTARRKLPAWDARSKVVDLVARHDVVLVAGETGCGKSTQVPQFLFDASGCEANIACSQPRRLSAIAVAERVAAERGENCGQTVGYQVRFESSFSAKTRLLFATPGVLLRKLGSDPDLVSYTHFLLDEVHEEDRDTEFLLVALRELVARRREAYDQAPSTAPPPLKLVLMSATLGLQKLGDYFGGCPSCSMGGTNFPVTTFFLEDVLKQTKCASASGGLRTRAGVGGASRRSMACERHAVAAPPARPRTSRARERTTARPVPSRDPESRPNSLKIRKETTHDLV